MTSADWIATAKRDLPRLKRLVDAYHPVHQDPLQRYEDGLPITAPGAEAACIEMRKDIKSSFAGNPTFQLEAAVQIGDISTAMTILNQAWIGVPESHDCWRISGFREAVALLEDPPDDEGVR